MMANEAAIQASYADYRRVKGRKVLQLVLEVPLEQAPQVHEAFGEPLPDGSTWVAVARIALKEKSELKGGKICQSAAILCGEAAFHQFLGFRFNGYISKKEEAAQCIRNHCEIQSRTELDHNTEAARKFRDLQLEYNAWKIAA